MPANAAHRGGVRRSGLRQLDGLNVGRATAPATKSDAVAVTADPQLQVLGPIVGLVTIDVMHGLVRSEVPSQYLRHDDAMLEMINLMSQVRRAFLARYVDHDVSVFVYIPQASAVISRGSSATSARIAAVEPEPPLAYVTDLAGSDSEGLTTGRARHLDASPLGAQRQTCPASRSVIAGLRENERSTA